MKSFTILPATSGLQQCRNISTGIGFLLQLAVLDSLIMIGSGSIDDGSLARQLLWGSLGMAALIYIVVLRLTNRDSHFDFGSWPIALLLCDAFASTFWSMTPASTIKRSIVLGFVVLVCGVSLGTQEKNWRNESFSKLMAAPMAWVVGLSAILTLVAPGRAFTDIGWRGVASHKNEAGQMMAFTILLLSYGMCHEKLSKSLRMLLIILAIGLLFLSKSTTALLALILGVAATEMLSLWSTIRRMGSWKIAFLGALLGLSGLLFFVYELGLLPSANTVYSKVLTMLGKSETFTGRTAIWQLVLGESRFHNPWLGGGYGGFWVGRNSISGYVTVGDELYPGQAHNGYIDVFNDLGILGLCVLAIITGFSICRACRLNALGHPEAKLHLSLALMCIFLNLGESTFFRNTVFMNIVFIASSVRAASLVGRLRVNAKQQESSIIGLAKGHIDT